MSRQSEGGIVAARGRIFAVRKPGTRKRRFAGLRKTLLTSLLLGLAAGFVFPIVLTFTNSLMTESEITNNFKPISANKSELDPKLADSYIRLKWIPQMVTLRQYYNVLVKKQPFLFMFWNSVLMVVPIIAGQLVVSALAGYAFSQLRFRFREPLFFMYIVTMLMPFQVTLVPNFIVADRLGLLNSYWAIILPGIFSAFGVFLMRQFMLVIPYSYIEAARADGAGHLRIFTGIVLPMCKPGLAALAILAFVDNWNMVEQPLIFLRDAIKQPLSVYLSAIGEGERGLAFAACAIYMAPMLLMMLYAEQHLIEGIQLSGIKG
ncbi:carbohydrate ABC transporter permease [Paenibacillus ginsengarvi]|uniref:Carbohydrate ABC transporter permease n=1 Tax=Paenibacillus ginsengarvi TaxID=400777 RepID=A0A3B0CKK6_9BACL|nr:carbohydrate ABC transporter permease [Paenibacillus ginsengarvi]RKN84769.1 carbohydrate ABC transporter permease [Paenibacillus ginsengarvi]